MCEGERKVCMRGKKGVCKREEGSMCEEKRRRGCVEEGVRLLKYTGLTKRSSLLP